MAVNGTRNSPIVTVKAPRPREDEIDNRPMVLVVDDESAIADTVVKILNLSGYAAVAAYDADEALETALISPPSLLITDVILPGKNGIELAITIKRIYPECKTLLFSGQASTADVMASANRAGYRFTLLNKPVPPQKLLQMVEENLGNSAVLSEAN
ncbi:MAG: response regulator [Terracidiphilus sp.]|jgi:DNA-binding NtrC family response regulator